MCETTLFLKSDDEQKLLESVGKIVVKGSKLVCTTIFGETKEYDGLKIVEADFIKHKIVACK